MTDSTSNQSRWQAIVGVLGIAVAVGWFVWIQPRPVHPLGSDWGHHFTVAEFIWHPSPDIGYPLFRRPWYGWLVGALGEGMGYLEAAQLLGYVSAILIILAAGIGAWALAGPFAAVAAAMIAAWMPLVREGGLWVNHYPLLGAACGLALAGGAAASRWPRLPWMILAGLAAGAAAAIDVRGEFVLPAVGVMVLAGLPWARNWAKTGGLLVAFLVSAAAVPSHWAWLESSFNVPKLEFEAQVEVQRKGVLGQIQGGTFQDPALEAACAGLTPTRMDMAGVTSPCADRLRGNALDRLSSGAMVPGRSLLWILPLVLIPVGRRWATRTRSTLASAIVFGVPVSALWVGMGWVTYFPRYVLPFAAVLAMLLPVAAHRACRAAGLTPRWLGMVAAVAGVAGAVCVWPGMPQPLAAAQTEGSGSDRAAGHFAQWVDQELGAGDFMVDCAGLAVDSLLLPRQINYLRFPPGDEACAAHIRSPAESSWSTH